MNAPESNWQRVSQFVSDLRNASRLATYVDTVVDVYESGAWREYTDEIGRSDHWRVSEFDYFLIACGAEYGEVQRLLAWDRARAAELASAMQSDDSSRRRSFVEASAAWASPTGAPLIDLARKQGWTKSKGQLRVAPAPQRARARARHGVTMDQHARQARASKIANDRRQALDEVTQTALNRVADTLELRYLIDRLREELSRRTTKVNDAST